MLHTILSPPLYPHRCASITADPPHASRTQAHAEKAKGQKETRDTSDIAYPRMRRMYRAFISTLH